MKAQVISQDGSVKSTTLNEDIFAVSVHPDLLAKALLVHASNRRNSIAHTKTKGEVAGGGRKPYRQKGTGNARQGSTRNPHYVGGGVAFGPRSKRNYNKSLNGHEKILVKFAVLSMLASEELFYIADMDTSKQKLSDYAPLMKKFDDLRHVLVVSSDKENIGKAIGNMDKVQSINIKTLSIENMLNNEGLCFTQEAMKDLLATYELTV